ncbi:RHS repeat-associated core domain-containing protein [Nitrospira japonica]|uniref:RHS repeat-associated core domain-containing protein n=1 Tax=Nitrospira japonica TaxID=1325564 RepID=A0A1W1I6W0_9BACT|nr:SpvB/TcaC N-terminal domain-containing protein [Nitrospira japonica]SLM48752.1 RHS repeat-associated core domain-containing protein [Nitrospira japonica]
MPEATGTEDRGKEPRENSFQITPPAIALPKGGGAIHGMGEKFGVNPVTGTGSLTIPIYTSPGRAGFGPQLNLSYDSGSGNGPFGFGWSLSLPSVSRKTAKGLPRYDDAADSDVFILSGAEDLVPILVQQGAQWIPEVVPSRTIGTKTYHIRRYRPRIEGLFARIECWTNQQDDTDVSWRSISKDNLTTWYGKTPESRVFDPADPSHIFSWLICESHDDKGQAIVYSYKPDDSEGLLSGRAHEKNRTTAIRGTNRYLKRIKYGNRRSRLVEPDPDRSQWLFEVVFDYGEHDSDRPQSLNEPKKWECRQDPFSTYRAGFEVRTYRLCQRVLMFHHFPDEDIGADCLVRSTDLTYSYERQADDARSPTYSFIESVEQVAYQRNIGGTYDRRSFPPVTFEYAATAVSETIRDVDPDSLDNLPFGLDGRHYQWVDLDGEGLAGILTEQGGSWLYKRNLSPATEREVDGVTITDVCLAPVELVASKPSLGTLRAGGQQLLDLAGDGQLDLVLLPGPAQGFYERTPDGQWTTFRSFQSVPNCDWFDPHLKFIDLTGDGHADLLITEDDVLRWHPSLAEEGFGPASYVRQARDEETGPRLILADGTESIVLADMSGDGLVDIVRIRNGEICYWPNLGYGRFGAKVTMDQSPWFEEPDLFDPLRLRLADIDGSGTTDILYLSEQGVHLYFNQSGNGWAVRQSLKAFPPVDDLAGIMTADLFGNGTACLVWSSPAPGNARRPMRYVDLMGGRKPHVMVRTANNLGAETRIEYAPSTKFYVADRLAGKPWATKIPFPVHCVEKITVADKWRRATFSFTYSYHHGYFDGIEREFRGFGRVEQTDTEDYGAFAGGNVESPYITDTKELYQPPVKTVTWFHTGAFLDRHTVLGHFQDEYFPNWYEALKPDDTTVLGGFRENTLPEPDLIVQDLSADEWRQALRACKGMVLRREIYELDVDKLAVGVHDPVRLFSTAYHNCHIRRVQPAQGNPHAVFLVTECESITYQYELDLTTEILTPDPRVAHTLNLRIDEFGNVQQSVAAVYPRFGRHRDASLPNETEDLVAAIQRERHLVYTETRYTADAQDQDNYRLRLPCEVSRYDVTGITPLNGGYFALGELRSCRLSPGRYQIDPAPGDVEVVEIPYHQVADGTSIQKRLIERLRTLFFETDLATFLPLGGLNSLALKYEDYKLALTDDLLEAVFGTKLAQLAWDGLKDVTMSGYISGQPLGARFPNEAIDGEYWVRSGTAAFSDDAAEHFYLPERYADPFGHVTTLLFDRTYDLFIKSSTDALGNTAAVEAFDYRVLAPSALKDMNDNLTEMRYDILGLPAVMAMKGKGTQGDSLDGITPAVLNPSLDQLIGYFQGAFDNGEARRLLGNATVRYVYHMGEERQGTEVTFAVHPPVAGSIVRERHVAQLGPDEESRLQAAFEYSDGLGALLVTKSQAEPAAGSTVLRWIASGKTVFNNKGKPVKQYEPYFSTSEHRFDDAEAEAEMGVTPIMYYDAVGRLIRTELPDGSFSRVVFSPWHVTAFDRNDTAYDPTGHAHSDWYKRRTDPAHPRFGEFNAVDDRRAADLVKVHAMTPAQVLFDSRGREAMSVAHNAYAYPNGGSSGDERYVTFTKLDAEGKPLWIRDGNRNLVMQYITPPKPGRWSEQPNETVPAGSVPCYDLAGHPLYQHSMDAGDRWTLNDAAGMSLYAWDLNERRESDGSLVVEDRQFHSTYDALHRPSEQWLTVNASQPQLIVRFGYGEREAGAKQANIRGRLYEHIDQSGRQTADAYDFKGNVVTATRQLAAGYREPVIGWQPGSSTAVLEAERFEQRTEYDAVNRITRRYNWHSGTGGLVAVYELTYNERGALQREEIVVRGLKTPDGYQESTQSRRTAAIAGITYNAKGQRERIEYGNGTTTCYDYDAETFRLTQLRTTRPAYDPPFPSRRSQFKNDRVLQNLFYAYDPVGNIMEIEDDAYEPAFFDNQQVDPKSQYVYDALYRLIFAMGRQNGALRGAPANIEPDAPGLSFPVRPTDPHALSAYRQTYRYDPAGNILRLRHDAGLGSWTRDYAYAFEDAAQPASNRLWQTWDGGDRTQAVSYAYDVHGSMQNLANVTPAQYVRWDYRDMIRELEL